MIKIYTTPNCHYCHMAKEYFQSKGVQYAEANVILDMAAQKEMIEKTGQYGVPVIDINGKIILGFDRQAIDNALK